MFVFAKQLPDENRDGHNHFFYKRGNLNHVVFTPVARDQERTVKRIPLRFAGFSHGIEYAGDEVVKSVGRLYPTRAFQNFLAGIPETVGLSAPEQDGFSFGYKLFFFALYLVAKPAFGYRQAFLLLVMHVKWRPNIGGDPVIDYKHFFAIFLDYLLDNQFFAEWAANGFRKLKGIHG